MKDYEVTDPEFNSVIQITETTDTNHADNINHAPIENYANTIWLRNLLDSCHNQIYRGKYLGDEVTADQYNAIEAGTFDDMYIGDYWTIDGYDWVIADFDYWLGRGDTECTKHHIVIVPSTMLYYNTYMNDSNTTEGAYQGSYMYTDGLAQAKEIVNGAFGSDHVLSHREYLENAITSGRPSAASWCDSTVELMGEVMVYGCPIRKQMSYGGTAIEAATISNMQLSLFRYNRKALISYGNGINGGTEGSRDAWWLRDVVSATDFAYVGYTGIATTGGASGAYGVRPCFGIVKS